MLRQPPLQGHLTALVTRRRVPATPSAAALVPAASGLALSRARPAPEALPFACRARCGCERTQVHLTLHLDQMVDRKDPAAHRGVVVHDHRLAYPSQPERAQRLALPLRRTDRA